MDLADVLTELRCRRACLSRAIDSLERMGALQRRGPGRPPKLTADIPYFAAGNSRLRSARSRAITGAARVQVADPLQ